MGWLAWSSADSCAQLSGKPPAVVRIEEGWHCGSFTTGAVGCEMDVTRLPPAAALHTIAHNVHVSFCTELGCTQEEGHSTPEICRCPVAEHAGTDGDDAAACSRDIQTPIEVVSTVRWLCLPALV